MKIVHHTLNNYDTLSHPNANKLGKPKRGNNYSGVNLHKYDKESVNKNNYRPAKSVNFCGSADFNEDKKENKAKIIKGTGIALGAIALLGAGLFIANKKGMLPESLKDTIRVPVDKIKNFFEPATNFLSKPVKKHRAKAANLLAEEERINALPWLERIDARANRAGRFSVAFNECNTINKAARFAKAKEAIFSAIISLGLAGVIKPVCVMAMPGAKDEDKQMIATKNFLAAMIGFGLSMVIMKPVDKAVGRIMENPENYIKGTVKWINNLADKNKGNKIGSFINNHIIGDSSFASKINKNVEVYTTLKNGSKAKETIGEGFKTFVKNCPEIITAPTKAYLTIKFMPPIMKLIFGDKKKDEQAPLPVHMEILNNPNFMEKEENKVYAMINKGAIV